MKEQRPWHGWAVPGELPTLHIGKLPGRKSVCLYIDRGTEIESLAFFRNEADARTAMAVLDHLMPDGSPMVRS